ncbi:MAG: AAA family ATPase [Candidatus Moranbacteria bacterium]|nr:AAA family ATPase [Candidatus Moranbacteria bacterium]
MSNNMISNPSVVCALLGMPGSGKSEAIGYLVEKHQWPKVYFGQVTMDEIERRGLDLTPENERIVREDLRAIHGKDHYALATIEKIRALGSVSGVFVESLYSWTEYKLFREHFGDAFVAVAVHTPPRVRYDRLAQRPERPLNPEQAQIRDYAQIEKLEQGGPIAMADFVVSNVGNLSDLTDSLDVVMDCVLSR